MSDEEVFTEEEIAGGDGQELGGKTGFIPAVVLRLLKWVALGLAAVIFIVTIVVVTVSILNKGPRNVVYPSDSVEYNEVPDILQWYDLKEIRVRTSDKQPVTVVIHPKLGYKMADTAVQTDLIARNEIIVDRIRSFFAEKVASELTADKEQQIKNELKQAINKLVENQSVKEIVFLDFNVIEF